MSTKKSGFEDMVDDSAALFATPSELPKPPTPEEVAKFKKGDILRHIVWGIVLYASKVRGKPNWIVVTIIDDTGFISAKRIKVKVADVVLEPRKKLAKKQSARLILARCEECDLRIRASMTVYGLGTAICFNDHCPKKGAPLTLEVGEDGSGTVGQDQSFVAQETNAKHAPRKPKGAKAASYLTKDDK